MYLLLDIKTQYMSNLLYHAPSHTGIGGGVGGGGVGGGARHSGPRAVRDRRRARFNIRGGGTSFSHHNRPLSDDGGGGGYLRGGSGRSVPCSDGLTFFFLNVTM